MLLNQEFTHEQVIEMQRQDVVIYFLNNAVKHDGNFAYAKNGMKLRAWA